jgi:hypothetical protein
MEPLLKKTKRTKKSAKPEQHQNHSNDPLGKWIDRNSLIRLKLTIVDALGPTLVKQNVKRIEYLDSYVTSKVWNDVSSCRCFFPIYVFQHEKSLF